MFKDRLRSLREEGGYTQAYTAKAVNIGTTAYSNYERGIREPDLETLLRMADFFNCTTDYLVGKSYNKNELESKITFGQLDILDKLVSSLNMIDRSHLIDPIVKLLEQASIFKGDRFLIYSKFSRFLALYLLAIRKLTEEYLENSLNIDSEILTLEMLKNQMIDWVKDFIEWIEGDYVKFFCTKNSSGKNPHDVYNDMVAIYKRIGLLPNIDEAKQHNEE